VKHNAYYVEVWKRGGGLVIRSERTDSAERAKQMAMAMSSVDQWYVSVTIEHPYGTSLVGQDNLDRLDTLWTETAKGPRS
jgi:hypothetical protein